MLVCERRQGGGYLHVHRRKQLAWPCVPGQRSSTTFAGWAEVGEGGALPSDGADERNEVLRKQVPIRPCKEAGVEGVAATLGEVEKCQRNSLRGALSCHFFVWHRSLGHRQHIYLLCELLWELLVFPSSRLLWFLGDSLLCMNNESKIHDFKAFSLCARTERRVYRIFPMNLSVFHCVHCVSCRHASFGLSDKVHLDVASPN